jgi:hypothetical protein
MEQVVIIEKGDLDRFFRDSVLRGFSSREVDARAAASILDICVDTLDRWIARGLVHPSNAKTSSTKRVERKFNLGYLLTLDVREIKSKYRQLSKY